MRILLLVDSLSKMHCTVLLAERRLRVREVDRDHGEHVQTRREVFAGELHVRAGAAEHVVEEEGTLLVQLDREVAVLALAEGDLVSRAVRA